MEVHYGAHCRCGVLVLLLGGGGGYYGYSRYGGRGTGGTLGLVLVVIIALRPSFDGAMPKGRPGQCPTCNITGSDVMPNFM